MIFSVVLPRTGTAATHGIVHRILAAGGDELRPGSPLLEVRVDLPAENAQDCPPLFFFRLVATERGVLREWMVAIGDLVATGQVMGIASSAKGEPLDPPPARSLRTTPVAIQVDPLSRR